MAARAGDEAMCVSHFGDFVHAVYILMLAFNGSRENQPLFP